MANELNVTVNFGFRKNNAVVDGNATASPTISGNAAIKNIQNIGTSEETLVLGDVAVPGYVFLHNLDATNYIAIGFATTVYPIRLQPGAVAIFPLNGASFATIYAKANTAACDLEYGAIAA